MDTTVDGVEHMNIKPDMDYWTVDMCTNIKGRGIYRDKKKLKFNYQRGYDPSEFVHKIWKRYGISLGNGQYVIDRTSEYFWFTNYILLEDEDMFNNLNLERLVSPCWI